MKLVRLSPQQVMEYWDQIIECIEAALPLHVVDDPNARQNIQSELLVGQLDCWAAVESLNDPKIFGIITTKIIIDSITQTRSLLIFTVALYEDHEVDVWKDGYRIMSEYAQSRNCVNIIGYSNNPRMINIADQTGGDTSWRLIVFAVLEK